MDKNINQEAVISAVKSVLSIIPFGIGTALDEIFFEYRGRLKQKRLEEFIQKFGLAIGNFSQEQFNIENIKTADFSDFFENLIIQVTKTNSKEKVERFKNLLVNQLISPSPFDEAELILCELFSSEMK